MAGVSLYDYQKDAVAKMKNGCILCGGVGSGKSRTALAYYYLLQGGQIGTANYIPMNNPKPLYIITTARKRDTLEWEEELVPFHIDAKDVVIDSWNNIAKYKEVEGAFFIFDEQRVVGKGAWVKSFLKIAKVNEWILLSATPGDTWTDYIPVFIANGFYKNRTEFNSRHVVFSRFTKFPKVDRYVHTGRLIALRNYILVDMDFHRETVSHHEDIIVSFDPIKYKEASKTRWDPYKNEPMKNAADLCYVWRRIVNEDPTRQASVLELVENHPRVIIFYNFNYELELLRYLFRDKTVAEWNGHRHQPIPKTNEWVYLVHYTSGCEGWNCVKTNAIIFYSQNYSYKVMTQAAGRIDRLNTPYKDLYYYHLKSRAGIDLAISRALKEKKDFNEKRFVKW